MSRQKSQLKLGAVLSYLNMGIGSLIPMLYTPIMLGLLGSDEYGLYRLATSVTSYLSIISFGIGSAIVRYLTKYRAEGNKEGEENMLGLFNIIFSVIAAITIVAGLVIAANIGLIYSDSLKGEGQIEKMQILVFILAIQTAFNFIVSPYSAVVSCYERFIFLQLINILLTVVIPVVNIVVLYLGFASIGMALSSMIISIIVGIVYYVYTRQFIGVKARYNKLPIFLIKELLVFSFWVFVANIVSQLYNTTDTLIIGAIPALATTGVAIYSIGVTFNSMMLNFSLGISNVLTPRVNQMVFGKNDNTELSDLLIQVGRIQGYIIGIVCSGFIVFGRQFIELWVGSEYNEAYWVAIVTMIPACVPLMQSVALNVIVARNKHRFRSLVYLLIAVINVVGTIILVNNFGIIGAALVTGLANVFGQGFIMNWYYWKKMCLDIPRFWRNIVKQSIVPVIMTVISLILLSFIHLDNWVLLFTGIAVYTIIFVFLSWKKVMNDYEKDIFRKPAMGLLNKFKKKDKKGDI